MMWWSLLPYSLVLLVLRLGAHALEDVNKFEEGPCSLNTARPVFADRSFVDSLRYLPGGSKYHLYFPSSKLLPPQVYREYPESDFYYDSCPSHNISHREPIGAIFATGRVNFVGVITTPPGLWVEGRPLGVDMGTIQHRVTLTDHKTFAFFTNCLTGPGLRTWNFVSSTPDISPRTKKLIEEHAISQGFKREHFVFFRYDSCRKGLANPLLEFDETTHRNSAPHLNDLANIYGSWHL